MIEFKCWDTKFKINNDNLYRVNKRNKKWINCMKNKPDKHGYINIGFKNDEKIWKNFGLHRLIYYGYNQDWDIMDTTKNNLVDHIDRNTSNNHISNLRVVSQKQNNQNSNRDGYSYHKNKKKYTSSIKIDGKGITLGEYLLKNDARMMYLIAKDMIYKTLLPTEVEEMTLLKQNTNLDIDKLIDKYITNHNKSKFKGYYQDKRYNKYYTEIYRDKVKFRLGYYENKDNARMIYLIFKDILEKLNEIEMKELIELKEQTDLDYEAIIKKYTEKYNI